jgi:serine/threonine-protein kinase RsbW
MRWERIFPGRDSQVREARHFVRFLLSACPVREDAELCVTELASNACLYTASGHGGWFGVSVTRQPGLVIIAVTDSGGPGFPALQAHGGLEPDEGGYGLHLVDALSDRWSSEESPFGRVTWAAFTWGPDTSDLPAAGPPWPKADEPGAQARRRRLQ